MIPPPFRRWCGGLTALAGAALIALPAAGPASARPPAAPTGCVPVGSWVVPTATGPRRVAAQAVLAAGARGGVVLLGERHDREADHRWQLATLEALLTRRPALAVGLEMVPRRLQPVLDRWVAGDLEEADFLEAVEWRRVWGFDPALYLPILRLARQRRIPLLALNVDAELVRRVRAVGWDALPAAQRQGVGRPAPPRQTYLQGLYAAWLAHRPGGGSPGIDDPAFRRFVESQQVWDRAMAEAIAAARARRPADLVVALVGVGHLAGGEGVPHQLRDLGVRGVSTWLPWDRDQDCRALVPGLADAVAGVAGPQPEPEAGPPPGTRLGVYLETLGGEVRILRVAPGSLAAAADLRVGDRILTIDDEPARTARQVIERVRRQPAGLPLRLRLRREGRDLERVLRLPAPPAAGAPPTAPVRT